MRPIRYLERGFDFALSELFAVFKNDGLPCLPSFDELAADMSLLPVNIHMYKRKMFVFFHINPDFTKDKQGICHTFNLERITNNGRHCLNDKAKVFYQSKVIQCHYTFHRK